jgi:hypothetical protein
MLLTKRIVGYLSIGFLLSAALGAGPGWGRLRDPGLSEREIRRAWKSFDARSDTMTVKGDFPYMACFRKTADKYKLPLALLLAMARGESNFDRKAVSTKDCLGIMQIRWPGTANDLGITRRADLFDPCINIDAGGRYLSWLLEKFGGDTYLAVAAYNYGPNAVSSRRVPRGAQWYAAYIHGHLRRLDGRHYRHTDRILVLEYTDFKMATAFKQIFEATVRDVPFEIYKSNKYTFDLYIVFENDKKRRAYVNRFRAKTGITPIGHRQ